MAVRTYGILEFSGKEWVIQRAEPHVCLKLKALFPKIGSGSSYPFKFADTDENAHDLLWFIDRYPLTISDKDLRRLKNKKQVHIKTINDMERILTPDYQPVQATLKDGFLARDYQNRGRDIFLMKKRLLIGDDTGLGKTLIGVLSILNAHLRPALVVCQTHLPQQWKEQIEKFTDLKVHIIRTNKAYSLPPADVYITAYSRLSGWVDFFKTGFLKSAIFDEAQELRRSASLKYEAAAILSSSVEYVLALTATPIYNYGEEIWNVLNIIQPFCLGSFDQFGREWCGYGKSVKDPQALGTYLRESFLMLRRTRAEVGRQLPPVNKIVHTVEYNESAAQENAEVMKQLAIKVLHGSFVERGQAGRELDIMVRRDTGVGKAAGVANYVRMILENGEPVILAGWHRRVYEIWMEMLSDFNPVMFTGSESPAEKEKAKQAFINGETNLFIISLRSGIGLDGLQHRGNIIAIGELDWSPKVHEQLISRVDRDGQLEQVTAIFLVCEEGSDPPIIDMLGLKSSQSHGILNPLQEMEANYSDESRMKILAQSYLNKKMA